MTLAKMVSRVQKPNGLVELDFITSLLIEKNTLFNNRGSP